jgi:hypothetical protein
LNKNSHYLKSVSLSSKRYRKGRRRGITGSFELRSV